jgi:hypothetical protein
MLRIHATVELVFAFASLGRGSTVSRRIRNSTECDGAIAAHAWLLQVGPPRTPFRFGFPSGCGCGCGTADQIPYMLYDDLSCFESGLGYPGSYGNIMCDFYFQSQGRKALGVSKRRVLCGCG